MAGLIPQDFINDLVARADIVGVIGERVNLRKAGKDYTGLCPFHDEKSPSFSVSADKQFYYCFGCGMSGTALTFLMEFDRLEFVPAVEALAAICGVTVPRDNTGAPRRQPVGVELFGILERAAEVFRKQLPHNPAAIDYLKERGLTGVTARDFGLGYAPDAWDTMTRELSDVKSDDLFRAGLLAENEKGRRYDRFRDRIMFPIRDTRGRVIAFGGRVMGVGEPKYLNSPETEVFHKSRELYGLAEARLAVRQLDELIVVEGYMDVIALAQMGISYAVATLGTATGQPHFEKLYRHVPRVTCCFDGDNAGRKAAWKALQAALPTLQDGRQLRFMFLPDGEDPDSLVRTEGKAGFMRRAEGAVSALDYLFDQLQQGLDLTAMDGRARLAYLAQPLIEQVPRGVLHDLLVGRLQHLVGQVPAELVAPQRLAPPAPGQSLRRGPQPSAERTQSVDSPLTKQLLALLLKYPQMSSELDSQPQLPGLLGDVLSFLRSQPNEAVGLAEVLGYWAGQPELPELLQLSRRAIDLSLDSARHEFRDGLAQLEKLAAAQERRALLRALGEANGGSVDPAQLADYWSQRAATNETSATPGVAKKNPP